MSSTLVKINPLSLDHVFPVSGLFTTCVSFTPKISNKPPYDKRSAKGAGPGSALANSRLSRALIIPAPSLLPHLLPASPAFCSSAEANLVSNEKQAEANSWRASKSQHLLKNGSRFRRDSTFSSHRDKHSGCREKMRRHNFPGIMQQGHLRR